MSIQFNCPHCGAVTQVDPRFAGKSGPCATCAQIISIPAVDGNAAVATRSRKSTWTAVIVIGAVLFFGLMIMGVLVALLLPAVNAARAAARRSQCGNNVSQIAMAINHYRDEHQHFPPAYTVDEDGRPLHSWRVLILPYLGPEAQSVHAKIKLGEPWNSPANLMYGNEMPPVFACPSDHRRGPNETSYCVIEGPGFLFDSSKTVTDDQFDQGKGASNTLMLFETRDSMINWMEPKDIQAANLAQGVNSGISGGCGCYHPGGAFGAYADGSIHFFSDYATPPESLKEMATWKSNEPQPQP